MEKVLKMKKVLLALFLFLLFQQISAVTPKAYDITSHELNVELDKQGKATVNEKYYMVFESKELAEEFRNLKNTNLGFNLEAWENFDSMLSINFGLKAQIEELKIDFAEEPSGERLYSLEFRYKFNRPAFNESEVGRKVVMEINKSFVRPLSRGTDYVIPAKTTLTFILPSQSVPQSGLLTQPNVRVESGPLNKRVIIPGSFSSNSFDFEYYYLKPISPSFSIALLVKDFAENTSRETKLALGFVIGMILLAIYTGRNRIEKRVTHFIVKHSELSKEK